MVLLKCRRSLIAIIAIISLTYLGIHSDSTSVAASIAAVSLGVAGANSAEKVMSSKVSVPKQGAPTDGQ